MTVPVWLVEAVQVWGMKALAAVLILLLGRLAARGISTTIKETFDREGISIPFPQRDIHMIPAATGAAS